MGIGLVDDLRDGIDVHFAPLTVSQYRQMIRDGILHDGEPIELIQGALLYKNRRDQEGGILTYGPRHLRTLNKLVSILSQWVTSRKVFLQVQGPVVVSNTSEPEPDCCLVQGSPDDCVDDVPQSANVIAVFEVSHSSLNSDRRTKQRLYANAGIPVYLIVNRRDGLLEILSKPSVCEGRYLTHIESHASESVTIDLSEHGSLLIEAQSLF